VEPRDYYHAVAIDALAIGRQLHEAADDLLVPLLLPPAPHISTGCKAEIPPERKIYPEKIGESLGPKSASPSSSGAAADYGLGRWWGGLEVRRLGFTGGEEEEADGNGGRGGGMGRRRRGRRSEKKALGISGCEPTCSGEKRRNY
jgi:hypothetical protein